MKKIFGLLVMIVLSVMGVASGQAYFASPETKAPKEVYAGKYMLVYRYWGTCQHYVGSDSMSFDQCWVYTQQFYDTKEKALAKLSDANGPGYAAIDGDSFVGIFKLDPSVLPEQMTFTQGDHVQKHEVEDREHWFKWEPRNQ